ncbi:hypothetical protein [Rosenbergiella epipactidis]|uniref:hypothetical protein n=1 Tax=Rosenbergiella epipactidis TaxID=1544694 RepID=UPI001F4E437B|nr:hypothetical protein [Rosenbergiella epipactidis]
MALTTKQKSNIIGAVESASNGKQTVRFTSRDVPCFFNVIDQFNIEDIDDTLGEGVHPAFIIDKVGTLANRILVGTYLGSIQDGVLISTPDVVPVISKSHDELATAAFACGNGFHLMTGVEFAMLRLLSYKNGWPNYGNTQYGESWNNTELFGRLSSRDYHIGNKSSDGSMRTLTGSGPSQWRLDGTPTGVSDISGNLNDVVSGIRIVGNEFQVLVNNIGVQNISYFAQNSDEWKAISGADGSFISPTNIGNLADGTYVATTPGSVRIISSDDAPNVDYGLSHKLLEGSGRTSSIYITNTSRTVISEKAIAKLRLYGVMPLDITNKTDTIWTNLGGSVIGECIFRMGGRYVVNPANKVTGINTHDFSASRSSQGISAGGRICYYE